MDFSTHLCSFAFRCVSMQWTSVFISHAKFSRITTEFPSPPSDYYCHLSSLFFFGGPQIPKFHSCDLYAHEITPIFLCHPQESRESYCSPGGLASLAQHRAAASLAESSSSRGATRGQSVPSMELSGHQLSSDLPYRNSLTPPVILQPFLLASNWGQMTLM